MQYKNLKFFLKHSIYALSFYYVLFLSADIASNGLVSRQFKISLLVIAIFGLAAGMALVEKKTAKATLGDSQKANPRDIKKATLGNVAFGGVIILILVYALYPHDFLSALVLALVSAFLFFYSSSFQYYRQN